jgi:ubiquitin carboxyl-terminal hydrolase 22/27/51
MDCKCIVHKTFGGLLQSDVTCLECGTVSSANDPILDISIDIKSVISDSNPRPTLQDCFAGYTSIEKLAHYTCKSCQKHTATKQLSFKKLAPVLSIQLKRFTHSASIGQKIHNPVSIPLEIDMTAFTSKWMKNKRKRNLNFDIVM